MNPARELAEVLPGLHPVLAICAVASIALLVIASVLCAVRVLRGPTPQDRVVALDLLSTIAVSVALTFAVLAAQPVLILVAMLLALLLFIGTVAFARYLTPSRKDGP